MKCTKSSACSQESLVYAVSPLNPPDCKSNSKSRSSPLSDRFRQSILKRHYPQIPIYPDIRSFCTQPGLFDVVCGGSPCTDLSVAGSRQGIGGSSSSLWFEMLRVVEEARPNFVLWENVAGCIDNGLRTVLGGLRMAGYTYQDPIIISADSLGAPHGRARIFVTAHADGTLTSENILQTSRAGQTGGETTLIGNSPKGSNQFCRIPRMDDGAASWLDEYNRRGWWAVNYPPQDIHIGSGTSSGRGKRVQAIGDAVVPQVAAIAWKRLAQIAAFLG